MKKLDGLFDKICTIENIELADQRARKGKTNTYGVKRHDKNRDEENRLLLQQLKTLTYKTSEYTTFKIYEPKERIIYRLPYYPDRIVHHAIMNVLEGVWKKIFIRNTYSSIKNRGIHACVKDMKKALKEFPEETQYCLKLDIRKFYPSVNHEILKEILRKKIKDKKLLVLLDEIIDSAEGVPIGNYLSQFFANLYLSYLDHYMKEVLKCKHYFRYADDIVILHSNKSFLHNAFREIQIYCTNKLKLQIKPNYQIFPVDKRGVDFVGYRFYHTHILLRKSIKKNINKILNKYRCNKITIDKMKKSIGSYWGWLKYCDARHFEKKIKRITDISC